MKKRITRRFIIKDLKNIELSKPMRYERYYINDELRVQKKGDKFEREILDNDNNIISETIITEKEFLEYKSSSENKIIRDSYLYLKDNRVSIKKYYDKYEGLIRAEVSFSTDGEMNNYNKEKWMGNEITNMDLAFDKFLYKLDRNTFLNELEKVIK